jgi:hypothetical protein
MQIFIDQVWCIGYTTIKQSPRLKYQFILSMDYVTDATLNQDQ